MLKHKRRGGNLTRSTRKDKRACNAGGGTAESLISGDLHGHYDQDVLTKLSDEVASNLSKSVVSLAVSKGGTILFACSGIAIERQGYITKVLTSAIFVRTLDDAKKRHDNLKIGVRHEGCEVHEGFLAEYNVDHNFAVVNIMASLDVHLVLLKCAMEILPSQAIAVGRSIFGEVTTRRVILASDSSGSEDSQGLMLTNSGISETMKGGPLFDFDGNFVGMNLYLDMETTFFLPWRIIYEERKNPCTFLLKKHSLSELKRLKPFWDGERPTGDFNSHPEGHRDVFNKARSGDLDPNGYPKPPETMLADSVTLVNSFEDNFGYKRGEGVWSELSRKVSSNIDRNIVALASFNGETRVFACTGFFIEWKGCKTILTSASLVRNSGDENKIIENLRIEVLLSNNRRREGTLLHYNLHYNVALVSVKDCLAIHAADIQPQYRKCSVVLAAGRCFKSGILMAAGGQLVDWTGTLDCDLLVYSSCKITKAGIGGPLVDINGHVVGMNFYDKKIGTPLLLWDKIQIILNHFEEISTDAEFHYPSDATNWRMEDQKGQRLNRWPVPMPYWRHRDDLEESEDEDEESKDEDEDESKDDFFKRGKFGYINGLKFYYF
ncbi:hypothetical protein ACP70R_014339 [Stipagrostis hirtigluma subsp. patula]